MTTFKKVSMNHAACLARAAVKNELANRKGVPKPIESTEPVSVFPRYVESKAFATKNTTSIIYCTTGEQFPYLKNFENEIGFSFESPSLIAAIYITARSNPSNWHLICAREDAANYTPSEDIVEKINAYFNAAKEPQVDELNEIHLMVETFAHPSDSDVKLCKQALGTANINDMLFEAAMGKFDTSQLEFAPRIGAKLNAEKTATNASTYQFLFRTFNQKTMWFSKQ